jgi:hypothetical protein
MESLEKSASPPDKSKDDRKKKEKKPGMLSGLFKSKKKDKKNKNSVDEDSDIEKLSTELARQSTSSDTPKVSPIERSTQLAALEPKSRGKLQKSQTGPVTIAPAADSIVATAPAPAAAPVAAPPSAPVQKPIVLPVAQRQIEDHSPMSFIAELEGSAVEAPIQRDAELRQQPPRNGSERSLGSLTLSSITHKMRHTDSQDHPKPKKAKKSKSRVELDDFDSDEENHSETQAQDLEGPNNAFMHGTEMVHIPTNLGDESLLDGKELNEDKGGEDSSVWTSSPSIIATPEASLEEPHEEQKHAPESHVQDDETTPLASTRQSTASTPQTPLASPPLRRAPSPPQRASSATPSNDSSARMSPSPISTRSPASTAGTLNTWSDASLRAWLDGAENDVRDMLVIIHDKTSVVPVTRDHPLMAGLFSSESRRIAGLQDELDGLFGNWLARKKSGRAVTASRVVESQ